MSRTAWSRASSIPSDRIAPVNASQSNRAKGKAKINEPPKSPEVLRLGGLVESLKASSGEKDPTRGCFCQARVHTLSKYTPICMHCGLVLCSLHSPHYSCPHCSLSLLNASSRDALLVEMTAEISDLMMQEREQRGREEQERMKAVGAFPTLSTSGNPQPSIPSQPRKVISLNAQTKRVTVASYNPVPSISHTSNMGEPEPAVKRTPPPPKGVDHVRGKAAEGTRWENLRSERIHYVPPPSQNVAESSGRRRRKKKGGEANQT